MRTKNNTLQGVNTNTNHSTHDTRHVRYRHILVVRELGI